MVSVGGESGGVVMRSIVLSVSSSVSSASNSHEHWKISVSVGSLGGGDDPCAIWASLSNLSRLSLL